MITTQSKPYDHVLLLYNKSIVKLCKNRLSSKVKAKLYAISLNKFIIVKKKIFNKK